MPWPLRAISDRWMTGEDARSWVLDLVPAGASVPLTLGAAFLVILIVLGLADAIERLAFARFAIGAVKDLRAEAFARSIPSGHARTSRSGDLVARLVGDAARLKAGLKGFFVHVATNSVVFAGVTAVLFLLDSTLGWIFALASSATMLVTGLCARRVFKRSLKNRRKEGRIAETIENALRGGADEKAFKRLNRSSGDDEASVTRISGVATGLTYLIFGGAVFVALWQGAAAVDAGTLSPGDMVVFMMYVLMMRGPIVRLARQGTRSGKIFAAGYRLAQIVDRPPASAAPDAPAVADDPTPGLDLADVVVRGSKAGRRGPRLGPIDLRLLPGEHVAIIGPPGAGKTTLLRVIAGSRRVHAGDVFWNGEHPAESSDRIAVLTDRPRWVEQTLSDLLPASVADQTDALSELIVGIAARLPDGFSTRIADKDLSPAERRAIALLSVLTAPADLRILDDPFGGLPPAVRAAALQHIRNDAAATVVAAFSDDDDIDPWSCFDRVVELDRGLIANHGVAEDRDDHDVAADAAAHSAPARLMEVRRP